MQMTDSGTKVATLFAEMDKKAPGNPWRTSGSGLWRQKNWDQIKAHSITLRDAEIGKPYFLIEASGSFYRNGGSIGYYLAFASAITVDQKNGDRYEVSLSGRQFHVTQDASFGNTPSKSVYFQSEGSAYTELLDLVIIDPNALLSLLEKGSS